MSAIGHYRTPETPGWDQTSPFKSGDRVNTFLGTGTIYQSGAYDSWIVLDTDWAVHYVRTEFVASLRDQGGKDQRLDGVQPGYPTIDELEAVGYEVILLGGKTLTLGQALKDRDSVRRFAAMHFSQEKQDALRVVSLEGYNEHLVVTATRDEPAPYSPIGLG